jgi:DNA helicase II / ATP-dependent DNA helicase PcrA
MDREPTSPADALLADLNAVQREAVTHPGGPLLILAGAGSGKTRVLTRRIAWLIRERGVSPQRILAVTFTNKAAGEMRDRVAALLGEPVAGLWIGTFHAICLRWLRRHAAAAGYGPRLSVFDQEDQLTLLRRLLKAEGLDDTPRRARDIHAIIGRAKNRAETDEAFAARARTPAERVAARLYTAYQQALRAQDAVDFDDLLLVALRLLLEHPEIGERYAGHFEHVLVDEYQDTNAVQFRLVERIARHHRNIFVVGDDDQSIYGWRGAEVRNILDFREHFPDPTVLYLEQNYRSTRPILDLANEVIRHNPDRWEKRLWTEREAGEPPEFFLAADEDEEAGAVAHRIARARGGGEFAYRDTAIFYRTHAQSRPLEDAFLRRAIPYVIVGGIQFYARREVKDLLSYLRALINPRDEESLRRCLGVPRRGIGEQTVAALLEQARACAADPLELAAAGALEGMRESAARTLREFGERMGGWRQRLAEPPERILSEIIAETGYEKYLEDQGGDWEERLANVRELLESARLFSSREEAAGVAAYVDQVSLMASVDRLTADADAVTLMTVHNAKGLEFKSVFVTGLEEGLLPHASALDDAGELAEERRLFYVACTRARERLTLSAAEMRMRFGAAGGGVSRFVADIPPALLRQVDAEEDAPAGEPGRAAPARSRWTRGGGMRGGLARDGMGQPRRVVTRSESVGRAGGPAREAVYTDPLDHPLVGRRVHHATFGHGIVIAAEGVGDQTRVTVRFHTGQSRKVLKNYLEWE